MGNASGIWVEHVHRDDYILGIAIAKGSLRIETCFRNPAIESRNYCLFQNKIFLENNNNFVLKHMEGRYWQR